MVSAEDPNAIPVEHYDGGYSMVVSLGGGQGSEPDRWAYHHGYSGYLLDDPTLEVNDHGLPYYTVTLLSPRLGWSPRSSRWTPPPVPCGSTRRSGRWASRTR